MFDNNHMESLDGGMKELRAIDYNKGELTSTSRLTKCSTPKDGKLERSPTPLGA